MNLSIFGAFSDFHFKNLIKVDEEAFLVKIQKGKLFKIYYEGFSFYHYNYRMMIRIIVQKQSFSEVNKIGFAHAQK